MLKVPVKWRRVVREKSEIWMFQVVIRLLYHGFARIFFDFGVIFYRRTLWPTIEAQLARVVGHFRKLSAKADGRRYFPVSDDEYSCDIKVFCMILFCYFITAIR